MLSEKGSRTKLVYSGALASSLFLFVELSSALRLFIVSLER